MLLKIYIDVKSRKLQKQIIFEKMKNIELLLIISGIKKVDKTLVPLHGTNASKKAI